jgi:hypothetical protein
MRWNRAGRGAVVEEFALAQRIGPRLIEHIPPAAAQHEQEDR